MKRRITPLTYRVPSDDVQGEGSFVDLKYITYGERQQSFVGGQTIDELLRGHVAAWDWVDNEDKPLPQPPEGLAKLVQPEIDFLVGALFSVPKDEAKN